MASDVETTVAFWTECFGATIVADTRLAAVRNILLDIGGGRLNLYDQPPNHRGPVNHLGIQVADVGATVEKLVAGGWTPRPIKTDGSLTYAMVEGPDQLLLEIFHFDAATLDPALHPYFDLDKPVARSHNAQEEILGTGRLSDAAHARLARPPVEPIRPPDRSDHAAVAAWRERIHNEWHDGDPTAAQCGFEQVMMGGVRCLRASADEPGPPADAKAIRQLPPLLIYFHGGGYALGSPEVALPITERFIRIGTGTGGGPAHEILGPLHPLEVLSVDYRLAPEHPYPAAVEDGMAVYHAAAKGEPNRRVVLGGDSAGANLALAVALQLIESAAAPTPSGLILLSPHLAHRTDRSPTDDPGSTVDATAAAWLSASYLDKTTSDHPGASPLLADLAGLPPTLVQVGTKDTSLDQSASFARRARAAGVEVTLDVWDGMWHTWHYHRDLPEADHAIVEAAAFANRCNSAP